MNYYNEFDRKKAEWLRQLIKAGFIAYGEVDERSICDVHPGDLKGFNQCHFFAGIGGWSYALRLAGWLDDEPVWTGSCPCQPFSVAGKGLGTDDPRHLWPQFHRLIQECRPPVVFGEQVASKSGREWLSGVRAEMETFAYAFGASDLCSAGVASPNLRQRLYWVADSECDAGKSRWSSNQSGKSIRTKSERTSAEFGRCGDSSCMGESYRAGRNARKSSGEGMGYGDSLEPTGGVGGVAQPANTGPQGFVMRTIECPYQWPPGTPNMAVFCRDGFWRRFKPGSQPLASGVPNRVALLRGFGDAINPWIAKVFIESYCEACGDLSDSESAKPSADCGVMVQ